MRWRWPPLNSVRIPFTLIGLEPDNIHQFCCPVENIAPGHLRVYSQGLRYFFHRNPGIERTERVLKHDLHIFAEFRRRFPDSGRRSAVYPDAARVWLYKPKHRFAPRSICRRRFRRPSRAFHPLEWKMRYRRPPAPRHGFQRGRFFTRKTLIRVF